MHETSTTRERELDEAVLLPCPFCGSRGYVFERDAAYWAYCTNDDCGAETNGSKDRSEAIANWNRRALPAPSSDAPREPVAAAIVDCHGVAVKLLWREALSDPTHGDEDVLNPAGAPHGTVALVAAPNSDDAWARILADTQLDRARSKLSIHELRLIIKHAQLYASPSAPASDAQMVKVWPDFDAPPKYDHPAEGWTDPRLPDFRAIWAAARRCGWAIGLHGSMKRDCDLIAVPWAENASPPEGLIEELCKALNATEVGTREAKPLSRVAINLQVDGWVKLIDLSIVGVPQVPLVTAVPTLTWPDGTIYQFTVEQGRRAIAAALKTEEPAK